MWDHYVSISLFVNVHRARERSFLGDPGGGDGSHLFSICFTDGSWGRQMGWVMVSDNDRWPTEWNRKLREREEIHGLFSDDSFGPIPLPGGRISNRDWQPLQVSTVYPVRAFRVKTAAQKAWELLLSGSRAHTEWYDASPDRRWSKLFGQTAS